MVLRPLICASTVTDEAVMSVAAGCMRTSQQGKCLPHDAIPNAKEFPDRDAVACYESQAPEKT